MTWAPKGRSIAKSCRNDAKEPHRRRCDESGAVWFLSEADEGMTTIYEPWHTDTSSPSSVRTSASELQHTTLAKDNKYAKMGAN